MECEEEGGACGRVEGGARGRELYVELGQQRQEGRRTKSLMLDSSMPTAPEREPQNTLSSPQALQACVPGPSFCACQMTE